MKLKSKILLAILLFAIGNTAAFSQELRLAVSSQPLDKVLSRLGVEVSFDSKAMSVYSVTVSQNFTNPKQAIDYLLKGKPYVCQQVGSVYVILKKPTAVESKYTPKHSYLLSGVLVDAYSGENLPYTYIQTNKGSTTSDQNGFFSLKLTENSPIQFSAEYLGYNKLDTMLSVGYHRLQLVAQPVAMPEAVIKSSTTAMLMQSGQRSGENRINHSVARYLPGSTDNSVFTLLRMMPGVRASGEPSEELMVWGSNGGESRILFDGFTLFGMKGFNDNIGSVNPYMVKDIKLMKGGYDASYGNQVGAIAEISGIDGLTSRPSFKANVSTLTTNIFGSIPVSRRSSLAAAYRQTFYNLYSSELLNPYGGRKPSSTNGKGKGNGVGQNQNTAEYFIFPNYAFRDVNIKYSGDLLTSDSYYISAYWAKDQFDFTVKTDDDSEQSADQKSEQYGGAAYYKHVWLSGASTQLTLAFSQLTTEEEHITLKSNQSNPTSSFQVDGYVREMSAKLIHNISIGGYQKLEIGGELNRYTDRLNGAESSLSKPSFFISDRLSISKLSIDGGLRVDVTPDNIYWQPRIAIRYPISERLTTTASWGLFNQYISRVPVRINSTANFFTWQLGEPLEAMHSIVGVAYNHNGFLASLEGYDKKTNNAIRLVDGLPKQVDVSSWGVDLFLKKNIGQSSLFGSYSFNHLAEPQSESGHELKLGAIISLSPFVLSASYVYGTGFSVLNSGNLSYGQGMGQGMQGRVLSDEPYSRMDIAATYRLKLNRWRLHAGVSLMNIFDTKNIKYGYEASTKTDPVAVYSQAIPFTPLIFVEILF